MKIRICIIFVLMTSFMKADEKVIKKMLFEAIAKKDNVEVERILKTGFRQSDAETVEDNLLVNAAELGNIAAVKLLLKYGWGINKPGGVYQERKTALHSAILSERIEVAKYFLNEGANVNSKDIYQKTPLHTAAEKGLNKIVICLVKKGAIVDAQDDNGWTPLHYSLRFLEITRYLLHHKANPNIKDKDGVSPLLRVYIQISRDKIEPNDPPIDSRTIELFKEHGAKLNNVETFFAACYNENITEMEKAIKAGIPIDSILDKSTCLVVAINKMSMSLVRFLVESGANVNFDKLDATPLFYAVKSKRIDLVEYLIKRGADVNLHPQRGISPLKAVDLQFIETTPEIYNLLLEKGAK
jgi:serine/threonine-protein phosphatase 6 regulatory ankyrin repeat subunit B